MQSGQHYCAYHRPPTLGNMAFAALTEGINYIVIFLIHGASTNPIHAPEKVYLQLYALAVT